MDNDTAQAYVEMFAQQTFDRAERTMRANKVTKYGSPDTEGTANHTLTRSLGTDRQPIRSTPPRPSSTFFENGAIWTPRLRRRSSSQSGMPPGS